MANWPSVTTDQVAAFVELARQGSLRAAAASLFITEQGVRNRLVSLEARLGVQLYRKLRGVRRASPLTAQGRQFLPHALAFLQRAGEMCDMFADTPAPREVNVVASQYLILYVLIDAVRRFHQAQPEIRVRLSARRERDIENLLRDEPEISFGVAAPYEPSPDLEYLHLFSMNWSVIMPRGHPLARRGAIQLSEVADQPLILYERGSTGRQHIVEAFQRIGLAPRVEMEATNTDLIVRMVESGLGVSIVPLMSTGVVTKGHRVASRELGEQLRPIHSGVLTRRGESLTDSARRFVDFIREHVRFDRPQRRGRTKSIAPADSRRKSTDDAS